MLMKKLKQRQNTRLDDQKTENNRTTTGSVFYQVSRMVTLRFFDRMKGSFQYQGKDSFNFRRKAKVLLKLGGLESISYL